MDNAKILLLNFAPAEDLSKQLQDILGSAFRPGKQLRAETIDHSNSARAGAQLTDVVQKFRPNVTFLVFAPEQLRSAGRWLRALKEAPDVAATIVVLEACTPAELHELFQHGAADFITAPLKPADTLARVWRQLEHLRWRESLTKSLKEKIGLKKLVGEARSFLAEIEKIPLIARCEGRVLISGETGTGKEMCARAIHYLSPRQNRPFVPVNCGAIPVELVENELFGHERGAFTGATTAQPGLIKEAEGGTLFLDEIDCLPLLAQTKLLRFLQEKEYRPLGSTKIRRADVRVVAASNADLAAAVAQEKFRQDLYYRLNIIQLTLPPLRERREDIPLLARHFLVKYAVEFDKPVVDLTPEAIKKLVFYSWPGNVRQLEYTIERAVLLAAETRISAAEITLPEAAPSDAGSFQQAKATLIAQFERDYIHSLLISHRGNISHAARAANKNRRAFWQLIRKYRIDVRSLKLALS